MVTRRARGARIEESAKIADDERRVLERADDLEAPSKNGLGNIAAATVAVAPSSGPNVLLIIYIMPPYPGKRN